MSGGVTTLESWKGKYDSAMESIDAHVGNKAYLPGGIALIVLAIALAALLAYGDYQLFQKLDVVNAIIPQPAIIVFGGGPLISMGVVGVHMVRHAIKYQETQNPTDVNRDL